MTKDIIDQLTNIMNETHDGRTVDALKEVCSTITNACKTREEEYAALQEQVEKLKKTVQIFYEHA